MSSMSDRPGTVIIGSRPDRAPLKAEQQHLSTFAGGMFGLGSQLLQDPDQMSLAVELTDSAIWAYQSTATGLMPEIGRYNFISRQRRIDTDTDFG